MSDVPEELDLPVVDVAGLKKILEKDLANIMKKAESGSTLTSREREIVATHLSGLERAAEPEAFQLEASGPASALDKMTAKQLAGEWGVSLRTVRGWIAEGDAANDPVPLKNPGKFVAWFERMHVGRVCPERYRNAAQRLLTGGGETAAVLEVKPSEKPPERIVIEDEAKGMLAMLERARETEARLGLQYVQAVEAGNEVRATFLFSQWTKMGEQLRALEKVAPQALEALGIYVRKDAVQRELEPLHRAIIKAFRQQLRMCRPRLRAAETADEWNILADRIVEEVAVMLVETEFREPLTLDAA